jgi:hypothetical protein
MMSSSVATGVLSALTGPQRLKLKLAREHPLDFNRSFGSLIFVAGTGRSGTTWLADVLNAGRGRIIFEPLRVRWGAVGDRELPRYIAPDTNDADLEQLVRSILLARFKSNEWTGRGNTRVVSRRRIIKDVHSNLRLGWLRAKFPAFPLFLIIRHPCAVAASRDRLGDARSVATLLGEPALVSDYLEPFMPELEKLETPFEHEVAWWCIETLVPLRQFEQREDLNVVFYEHLLAQPDATVEGLFRSIGEAPPAAAYEQIERPSLTTYRAGGPLTDMTRALDEWQDRLSPAQIERTHELLAVFGLDWLYDTGPQPLVGSGAEALRRHP